MSYDTRCLMTAEYFLGQPRTAADEQSLAQAIQDAVEGWFSDREVPAIDRVEAGQKETAP